MKASELFDWTGNPSWACEGGEHFDNNWVPDCGGKIDYDPVLLRMSCRVWSDGSYIASIYAGEATEIETTGICHADTVAAARVAVEQWAEYRARRYIAAAIAHAKGNSQ